MYHPMNICLRNHMKYGDVFGEPFLFYLRAFANDRKNTSSDNYRAEQLMYLGPGSRRLAGSLVFGDAPKPAESSVYAYACVFFLI